MSVATENIRNIAVVGHGNTGKTSIVEQILFNGGILSKAETVDSGKTVSDFTDEEKKRKISIHSSLTNINWNNNEINVLDTPGSSDFIGEVVASFRVAETGLVVIGAKEKVQIETIKLWRRLNSRNMPRAVFINKMDHDKVDFLSVLDDLKDKFKATFVPVVLPIGSAGDFKGVVSLLEEKAYIAEAGKKETLSEIPAELNELVKEYKSVLIESAAEGNDALLDKYFEVGTLSKEEILKGLQDGFKNNKIVPVFFGSAEINSGFTSLLNYVSCCFPSPSGIKEEALDENNEDIEVTIASEGKTSLMVFKTSIDQFSGKMSFIKVISNELKADMELINYRKKKKEKISKLYKVQGKKIEEVKVLYAGDIGVITKIESIRTNDTLSELGSVHYKALKLPHPVHSIAISADDKKSEDKLNEMLQRAAEEDLTFTVKYNKETKENVISGMGELHINIILDKIKVDQKINVNTKVPRIAYRETIKKPSDSEYTHKKQSGGHGQYGKVVLKIQPLERGKYYDFKNAIKGGSISKGYMQGIEKGLHEAMEEGILAGYPAVDIGITVIDGKEHPVDSSEMAFKLAAKGALKDGMKKAKPQILEPVMDLKVFADEHYLGDILSDLSSKRGKVQGQSLLGGGILEISAIVPQSELLRYSIDLRSITSGTASFEVEFDHYNPISGKIADQVIAEAELVKVE